MEYYGIFKIQNSVPVKTWKTHFSLLWVMDVSITSLSLGKHIVISDNPNLTNLVDIQLLHENCK